MRPIDDTSPVVITMVDRRGWSPTVIALGTSSSTTRRLGFGIPEAAHSPSMRLCTRGCWSNPATRAPVKRMAAAVPPPPDNQPGRSAGDSANDETDDHGHERAGDRQPRHEGDQPR